MKATRHAFKPTKATAPIRHPLKPVSIEKKMAEAGEVPSWPSFRGQAKLVGTSTNGLVTVYIDASLGQPAEQNAKDLVNDADRIVTANNTIFGFKGGKVEVIIFAMDGATDGTGGADHMGCDYVTGAAIEVCASFGNSARVSALFEAELSECSMNGRLCGFSTGEALSRWCASVIGNNALADFATAPTWFNEGMLNYVDETDQTDQNPISTGCGMAFLSWLMGKKGYKLDQIAQAMVKLGDSGTLAQLYAHLTSEDETNAFLKFLADVRALDNVTTDDPFGAATQPTLKAQQPPNIMALA